MLSIVSSSPTFVSLAFSSVPPQHLSTCYNDNMDPTSTTQPIPLVPTPPPPALSSSSLSSTHQNKSIEQNKYKETFQCTKCKETFNFQRYLNLHIRQVHRRKPAHHCPHCRNAFGTTKDVNDHIHQVHDNQKPRPYSCKLCTSSFLSKLNLRQHLADTHCRPDKSCQLCDFKSHHLAQLKQHLRDKHDQPIEDAPVDISYTATQKRTIGYMSLTDLPNIDDDCNVIQDMEKDTIRRSETIVEDGDLDDEDNDENQENTSTLHNQ